MRLLYGEMQDWHSQLASDRVVKGGKSMLTNMWSQFGLRVLRSLSTSVLRLWKISQTMRTNNMSFYNMSLDERKTMKSNSYMSKP